MTLLATAGRKRNRKSLPPLTGTQIIKWAECHKSLSGEWPTTQSGTISGTEETWSAVSQSLARGVRGLPGGSSLARLLQKHRLNK